jgi:transaldolase
MSDALADLSAQDVSVWLDDISRERLRTGNLQHLLDTKHVVGVTSNPTIFQKALEKGDAYDEQVRHLKTRGIDLDQAVRELMAFDIRWACDVLRPVFDRTGGKDGRVSIEVDPRIAHDTTWTTAEAKALWWLVDRPNVMIKIPATMEGLAAITEATAAGISVNVTLIFGLDRYDLVMDAYLSGLEKAKEAATCPRLARSRRSSSPAWTPRSTSDWRRSVRRKPRRCAARQASRMPGSPTSATRRSSPRTGGRRWPPPERTPNAPSGRPPG